MKFTITPALASHAMKPNTRQSKQCTTPEPRIVKVASSQIAEGTLYEH